MVRSALLRNAARRQSASLAGNPKEATKRGDVRHPLDLLPVRPHVRLEQDFFQRLGPVEQGHLEVVPVVELGVGEARPEDPLVPATTTAGSGTIMFETKANPGQRPPASSKTKYFWLFRMEVTRTSRGSARYFSSNRPA